MFSLFKKSNSKPIAKNSSTYLRENNISGLEDLKSVLNKNTGVVTKYPIIFQGLPLDEVRVKNLEKHFGNAANILDNSEVIPGHVVYFYRKHVESFSLIIQLHFINNIFFYASTKVSLETILTDNDKKKICSTLLGHYPDIVLCNNGFEYSFKDSKGNIISTRDHIYLYIKYYVKNVEIEKLKQSVGDQTLFKKIGVDNQEKLDNFI